MGSDMRDKPYTEGPVYVEGLTAGLFALMDAQFTVNEPYEGTLPRYGGDNSELVRTYSMALIDEVMELAKELGWKPWKAAPIADRERIADELADVLAFLGMMLILVADKTGLGARQMAEAYARKVAVNVERLAGRVENYGYNNGDD